MLYLICTTISRADHSRYEVQVLDRGLLGSVMVLGKLPVPGCPTIWIVVGQGPIVLAVGAGEGLFGQFYSPLSSFSLSLWETARYRLKYCLKGPLNPKQQQQQQLKSWVHVTGDRFTIQRCVPLGSMLYAELERT